MPTNPDAAPVRSQATLYPNWVQAWVTKPQGSDPPRPYRTPRQDADPDFSLEEELGAGTGISIKPTIGLPAQLFTGYYHECGRT